MKLKDFKIKELEEKGGHDFIAYASTYSNADREGDIMVEGCFDKSLEAKARVPMLFNHNRNEVIGHLELSTDEKGLLAKAKFNTDVQRANEVKSLVKNGDIDSMSIGFYVKEHEPLDRDRPFGSWKMTEVEVVEVSVVTVPSNPEAIITEVKSDDGIRRIVNEEIQKYLQHEKENQTNEVSDKVDYLVKRQEDLKHEFNSSLLNQNLINWRNKK